MILSICLILTSATLLISGVHGGYVNDYDEPFTFTCGRNTGISRIYSVHSDRAEDRRYGFECRTVRGTPSICSWHGYLNNFDEAIAFVCPNNGIINGFKSHHSNDAEDRRWKVSCCHSSIYKAMDCNFINWVNNWDQYFDYHVPSNKVLNGFASYHNNDAEDRRWKFLVCSFK